MPMHPFTSPTTPMHPRPGTTLPLLTELMCEMANKIHIRWNAVRFAKHRAATDLDDVRQGSAKPSVQHCASRGHTGRQPRSPKVTNAVLYSYLIGWAVTSIGL